MDPKEWAASKAQAIRTKREREAAESRARELAEKQRLAATPALWDEFKARVQERVNALNAALNETALTIQTVNQSKISVTTPQETSITAELRRERGDICCMLVSMSNDYQIRLVNGKASLMKGAGGNYSGIEITPDGAAEEFLGSLIQFI